MLQMTKDMQMKGLRRKGRCHEKLLLVSTKGGQVKKNILKTTDDENNTKRRTGNT